VGVEAYDLFLCEESSEEYYAALADEIKKRIDNT